MKAMDETVFAVQLEATCASQVSKEAVAVMRTEIDGDCCTVR